MTRPAETPARTTRPGRAGALVVSLLANVALAGGVAYLLTTKPPAAGPAGSTPERPTTGDVIEALGRVQPAGGVVSVFGPPGDRVVELKADLGSPVAKGDRLAVLSGEAERRLGLAALDAQLAEADALRAAIGKAKEARLADLKVEAKQAEDRGRADLAALDARIAGYEAQEKAARDETDRIAVVERGGVTVPAQQKSQADLQLTLAEQQVRAARDQRKAARDQLDAAGDATRVKAAAVEAEANRAVAQVPADSLRAAKATAAQKLKDADVLAPVAGRVVKVGARPGDTLTNVPVLQIADTAQMAVIAEVYETDVARLRKWLAGGKAVTAEVDGRVLDADTLRGTVTAAGVAPMIAKNMVFALGPREDADRRVVEVEVRLEPAAAAKVADFIGLQVRTRFLAPK